MAKPPSGAAVSVPPSTQWQRGYADMLDADPRRVVSIFREAETGDTRRMIDLMKGARALDSRLSAVCAARVQTLTGRPVVFHPPPGFEDDAEAKEIAANVAQVWNLVSHSFALIAHLHHAALEHIAAAEWEWKTDLRKGWVYPVPRHAMAGFVHSNRLVWNDQIEPCLYDDANRSKPRPLSDYPDQFIVHCPIAGVSDYPWRRGALRDRIIPSIVKRQIGMAGWAQVLERWGQPQVVAKSDDEAVGDQIIAALRELGMDWRAVFPTSAEVTAIPVSVDGELHVKFIDHVNADHAIRVLGQNLSTEVQGGSFAAASAHNRVRIDILAADALELAETLTHQWVEPVVRYNWPGAPAPYAEIVLAPRRELTVADFQGGLYAADEVRLSQGHEQEPGGRGARYAPGVVVVGAPGTPAPTESSVEPAKPSDTGEPGANLSETPAESAPIEAPTDADPAVEVAVEPVEKVADAALNGAQIQALGEIIASVERGDRAPATAIEMIVLGFPQIPRDAAQKIIATIKPGSNAPEPEAPPAA